MSHNWDLGNPFSWSGGRFGWSHPGCHGDLRRACARGDAEGVRDLLASNEAGTPGLCYELILACQRGDTDIVRMLLSAGADIHSRMYHEEVSERTAFHVAVLGNHIDAAAVCLDHGAEVDCRDGNLCTPMWNACYKGRVEMVRLLLDRGAGITTPISGGGTPLEAACVGGWEYDTVGVVRLLLARGADVNTPDTVNGGTCLHSASDLGLVRVTRILLDHGANPLLKDRQGYTVFDLPGIEMNTRCKGVRALLRKYVAIQVRTCVLGKHPRRNRLRDLVPRVASYLLHF